MTSGSDAARSALAFLTPFGGAQPPQPAALAWFPAVGLGLGGALGGLWWGLDKTWPAPVAAAIVVAADLAATGMLHVDGLADCGDGLLAHLPRERRLSVMAEPQVGAFGVITVGATLLARFAALSALRPSPRLLAGLWCLSRSAMALTVRSQPYARPEGGLASGFAGNTKTLAPGFAAAAGLLLSQKPKRGLAAFLAATAAAGGTVALARRRLGGYTGDVLGAAGVMGETAGLLVAAAKW